MVYQSAKIASTCHRLASDHLHMPMHHYYNNDKYSTNILILMIFNM